MKRRVVITGVGPVTPIGTGKEIFWNNLIAGKSGVGIITRFDPTDVDVKIAGEVKDFEYADYMDKKEGKRMDRVTHFAVAAAKLAVEDAKLDLASINQVRAGVCVGSGIGGIETFVEQTTKYVEKGPSKISPFFIPMEIPNMPAGQISIALGFKGPNTAIVTACATGTNCIGDAFRTIQYGDADIMIAGGTEAAISPVAVAGFANMKALSTNNEHPEKASCPFDKKREGFVMGEGAGVVFLEELEHAKKRGAHIYCEIGGYGSNADAYHITAPAPEGIQQSKCMALAVKDACLQPEYVDYVNAHGTSTHLNDLNESKAIARVFGDHAKDMLISSTKSMTGHLLGAAGAVEAIACAMTIETGKVHPTINLVEPEDELKELGLNYVPNKAVEADVNVAISNSFGFGGHNATLLFKKYAE